MYEEETSSIDDLNFLRANGDSCLLKSGDDCLSVKGRLRGALNFWNDIHAPQFILDVIESGYKLPLLQIPSPFVARNNSSALDESHFVESAINELILQGCVSEVFETPAIINPLSVSIQKSGKKRLILDLRHVNQFLYKTKFRCEDVSVAKEILNPGDFMFTFDLKSGYHHVEIFPEHRKYLSFAWTFSSGCTRYFEFSVLPFGLSSAPYLFTKLLRPLVKKWRSEAKAIVVFLDDGLGAAADRNKAKIASLQVHADLLKSGFLPNEAKCVWEPAQSITWLGTVLNTSTSEISATVKRINSLHHDLATILAASPPCHPVRKLASVCGKIISLGNCVGNVCRLMTRNLFAVINSAPTWNACVHLSSEALSELNFWKSNVASLNGIPIWPLVRKPSKIVYSDASASACASFIEFEGKIFHQNWSDFEKAQSSTYRELLAVSLSLKSFNESLKAQTVTWFTDNQNVVRIVSCGSKVPMLQELAMDIYQSCLQNAINIDIQWIPRDLNSAADDFSKFIDYDDYTINDSVFNAVEELWGPHSCDRFACSYNAKVPLFNSRFYQPGSSGVNAFSQDWSLHNNWLCPPVYLTCKVIHHMKLCSAKGTLIVPLWKSAHFWPILCSDGVHWSTFIHDWVILPNFPNLFIRGKAKNSIFGNRPMAFVSLALRIDFSILPRLDSDYSREMFRVPCI